MESQATAAEAKDVEKAEDESAPVQRLAVRKYLIAEYCDAQFYMGWHLYVRDYKEKQKRNDDGDWGWIRWRGKRDGRHPAQDVFNEFGIEITGDGTCDHQGIGEFAKRFQIGRQRVGGKPRACIEIDVDEWGHISLPVSVSSA